MKGEKMNSRSYLCGTNEEKGQKWTLTVVTKFEFEGAITNCNEL